MFLTDNYNIDVQYLSKNLSDNKHLVINIGPNITGVIIISPPLSFHIQMYAVMHFHV